ncbi:thiol-disulfide oxidoreductase DCC family protein [Aquihabitans sp. McL0605]|uniref:thiol-disulfide oxidoreductase DCC family protein n=1 Tax=Aquihabitans sp. McL0605 TaxID=3415671 RepID=UPI003CF19EFF
MTTVPELPAFLYDGDCSFCSSCARFIDTWIPTGATVVPWQWTSIDELGVTIDEVDTGVVWVTSTTSHTNGPEGIADLLRASHRKVWHPAGWLLGRRPVLWVAWPVYRWIARNRHRMPGGTAQCSLPQAQRYPVEADAD